MDAEQLGGPVRPALVKKVLSSQEYCLWQQAEGPDRLFPLPVDTKSHSEIHRRRASWVSQPPGVFDLQDYPGGLGLHFRLWGMGKPCGVFMRPPPAGGTGNQKIFLRFLSLP